MSMFLGYTEEEKEDEVELNQKIMFMHLFPQKCINLP